MKTEHWALLVSAVALVVSIATPIWQSRTAAKQIAANRRSLLLQTILSTKTTTYVAAHDLLALLQQYGNKMDEDQRKNLAALYPRLKKQAKEFEELHDAWHDFEDGEPLTSIESALTQVNISAAEANEMAKLIEYGRKTYEAA